MPFGPDPTSRRPILDQPSMVFLKPIITNPQIEVGDFSYYHSFDDPLGFERNVRYAFPFIGDRLVIGRFCAIAHGATFILNGGNHLTDTVSPYPFAIFGQGWEHAMPDHWPTRRLVVGHDVWIGFEASLMPGVRVGHGAVIAARDVVASDVPPYAMWQATPPACSVPALRGRHSAPARSVLVGLAMSRSRSTHGDSNRQRGRPQPGARA
jgi:virginiamycin A acetyltransferase